MVKKYGDLYLQARRALLPSEGENASMAAWSCWHSRPGNP